MAPVLLSLRGVSKVYDMGEIQVHALDQVDLEVFEAEFLVVVGQSGSGKSTLLNMMGGMDRPTSGQVIVEGLDLTRASDRQLTLYRRNNVGFVFQFFNLIPTLTALENIQVAVEVVADPLDALESLRIVGLAERAGHFPSQLSGGQQQRAETRLEKDYPINLPVSGRIGRIDFEPGDRVRQGQRLVEFDAYAVRTEADLSSGAVSEMEAQLAVSADVEVELAEKRRAQEAVETTRRAVAAIQIQIQEARVALAQAQRDLKRVRSLVESGALPTQEQEEAELMATQRRLTITRLERDLSTAKQRIQEAQAAVSLADGQIRSKRNQTRVVREQLLQAQTQLDQKRYDLGRSRILSPIDGLVMERLVQGPKELPAGTPLLLLGRPEQLEIVSEVLSQDALTIQEGTPVELSPGGGRPSFWSQVERIEPAGFTKLSSLGVEQQRVKVVMALPEEAPALGVAYELQARFVTNQKQECLQIGRFSVLQEPQGGYYVFRVRGDVLEKQPVQLGLRGARQVEILEGLTTEDTIVRVPDVTLEDGQTVQVKNLPDA